jgi:hypothetical protein
MLDLGASDNGNVFNLTRHFKERKKEGSRPGS